MPRPPSKPFSRSTKTTHDSMQDIKTVLKKFGAEKFRITDGDDGAGIEFVHDSTLYRLWQELPADDEREAARKFRVFYDRIRSTLIAVSEGLVEMSEVFLANIVNPETGKTVYEYMMQNGRLEEFKRQIALPPGEN